MLFTFSEINQGRKHSLQNAGACVTCLPCFNEPVSHRLGHSRDPLELMARGSGAPLAPVALRRALPRRPVPWLPDAGGSPPDTHSWKLAVRETDTPFCRHALPMPSPPTTYCCSCERRGPAGGRPGVSAAAGPRLIAVAAAADDCGGALGRRTGLRNQCTEPDQRGTQAGHFHLNMDGEVAQRK